MRFWNYYSEFQVRFILMKRKANQCSKFFLNLTILESSSSYRLILVLQYFPIEKSYNVSFRISFYLKNKVFFYVINIKLVRKYISVFNFNNLSGCSELSPDSEKLCVAKNIVSGFRSAKSLSRDGV